MKPASTDQAQYRIDQLVWILEFVGLPLRLNVFGRPVRLLANRFAVAQFGSLGVTSRRLLMMRFLTPGEWQAWCVTRQVPLRERGWIRPSFSADTFHCVDIPYPKDSGKKVYLAHRLFSLVVSDSETLVLVDDWGVWPSSQHLPLFTRFREALGEHRPLIEAPGHIATPTDTDDAISVVVTSILFIWDCYGISSSGRDAFYFSHDEYCFFASRDASVAERVKSEFAAA